MRTARDVQFLEETVTQTTPNSSGDWRFELNLNSTSTIDNQHPAPQEPEVGKPILDKDEKSDTGQETPSRRGPGRPKIIRKGTPGRPAKQYNTRQSCKTNEEPKVNQMSDSDDDEFYGFKDQVASIAAEVDFDTAISGPNKDDWMSSIYSEFRSLIQNDTLEITSRPTQGKVIGCRVVLRNKIDANGDLERRKARVVAKGFAQRPGIDFFETFAPLARMGSFRLLAAIAAKRGLLIYQIDIETAYLNGKMDTVVLMDMPKLLPEMLNKMATTDKDASIAEKAKKLLSQIEQCDAVCKLKKALYGLRQAGRQWHRELDTALREIGLKPTSSDPCVYIDKSHGDTYVLVYVDDILIVSNDEDRVKVIKNKLARKFRIKDLGLAHHCLGIKIEQERNQVRLSQAGYIKSLLEKFQMENCNPVSTPMAAGAKLVPTEQDDSGSGSFPYRELIGGLMYAATGTRPDIAHAVSALSQFSVRPSEAQWRAAKRVLRYLKGTAEYVLRFTSDTETLKGYVDADWGNCAVDRRSYTGYAFILGGAAISWELRKQRTVALSTTEAEYMAITDAVKETIFLQGFLTEMEFGDLKEIPLYNDNQGAGRLAQDHIPHSRAKHIDIRHHFVRQVIRDKVIKLTHMPTEKMIADVLTKGLPGEKHKYCVEGLGLVPKRNGSSGRN